MDVPAAAAATTKPLDNDPEPEDEDEVVFVSECRAPSLPPPLPTLAAATATAATATAAGATVSDVFSYRNHTHAAHTNSHLVDDDEVTFVTQTKTAHPPANRTIPFHNAAHFNSHVLQPGSALLQPNTAYHMNPFPAPQQRMALPNFNQLMPIAGASGRWQAVSAPSAPRYHQRSNYTRSVDPRFGKMPELELRDQATEEAATPAELNVELMPHQKRGLCWMRKREQVKSPSAPIYDTQCRGGILADDQGLGKTLTTISLLYAHPPADGSRWRTLIVCPKSLVNQWKKELESRVHKDMVKKIHVYHGGKKAVSPDQLLKCDVVITTYGTLSGEYPKVLKDDPRYKYCIENKLPKPMRKKGLLYKVSWYRVILDEAHKIRNHSTDACKAAIALSSTLRWCLSGTPVQNTVNDLYALLKFLNFRIVKEGENWNSTWKSRLESPDSNIREEAFRQFKCRIAIVMLRRTKKDKVGGEPILDLPPRETHMLTKDFTVKNEDKMYIKTTAAALKEIYALVQSGEVKEQMQNVLKWFLKLRQACVHPYLIEYCAHLRKLNRAKKDGNLMDQELKQKGRNIRRLIGKLRDNSIDDGDVAKNEEEKVEETLSDAEDFIDDRPLDEIMQEAQETAHENEVDGIPTLERENRKRKNLISDSEDDADEGRTMKRARAEQPRKVVDLIDDILSTSPLNSEVPDLDPNDLVGLSAFESAMSTQEPDPGGNDPSRSNQNDNVATGIGDDGLGDIFGNGNVQKAEEVPDGSLVSGASRNGHAVDGVGDVNAGLAGDLSSNFPHDWDGIMDEVLDDNGAFDVSRDMIDVGAVPDAVYPRMKTEHKMDDVDDLDDEMYDDEGPTADSVDNIKDPVEFKKKLAEKMEEILKQPSTKINIVIDKLRETEAKDPSIKTLIFSQWTSCLDIVQYQLEDAGISCCRLDGSMSIPRRAVEIERFKKPKNKAFLISLMAGGEGLNLIMASQVFLVDAWWNPAAEEQAIDRVHRIGQKRPVNVYRFCMKNTFENMIYGISDHKKAIIEGALGTQGEKTVPRQKLTLKEVFDLFKGAARKFLESGTTDKAAISAAKRIIKFNVNVDT